MSKIGRLGTSFAVIAAVLLALTPLQGFGTWALSPEEHSRSVVSTQCPTDENRNAFAPISVAVQSPNGGENWTIGGKYQLSWNASGGTGNLEIEIEYSTTGLVGPYKPVASNLPNSGTYGWVIPNDPSTDSYMKVTANDTLGMFADDTSNSSFEISNATALGIVISSPAGFAIWRGGTQQYINWTASGGCPPLKVKLDYQSMLMPGWNPIANNLPSNGSYLWTVPQVMTPDLFTIRATVSDFIGNNTNTTVNVIVLPPFAVMVSPMTATVEMNKTAEFTAQAYDWDGTPIQGVMYMWNVQSTGGGDGTVTPQMGNVTTFRATHWGTCSLIAVGFYQGAMSTSLPPATITIPEPPSPLINLSSPKGGETFSLGGICNITWKVENGTAPYSIEIYYSVNGGTSWNLLHTSVQSDQGNGTYVWHISTAMSEGSHMRIWTKVSDVYDKLGNSTSDNFTITAPKHLVMVSGANQNGSVDTDLGEPFKVRVTNRSGSGLGGVKVHWKIVVYPQDATTQTITGSTTTDKDGYSMATLHLGEKTGLYVVNVSAEGVSGEWVEFAALANPGSLDHISVTPSTATLTLGSSKQFFAQGYDTYNNTISGLKYTWSVIGEIGWINSLGISLPRRREAERLLHSAAILL